ncbi:hypothetical protein [Thioalkalivibrio sp. ALgr3]|uniref:hypothetical protein n=1 Tax=Thioalkalivibrio sp. ALgr3 TaxID=1239292 RepID=UPI0003AA6C2A|nr:hypothetical protein [Thioalkalivibrio sp. ALgr3]
MQKIPATSGSGAPPDPGTPTGRAEECDSETGDEGTPTAAARSPSMHEGVEVWCDCCSCEAEPYWLAVAADLGIDPD